MAVMDPFAGAQAENQDQKKALLDVIAQSGSAGEKAFHDAQAQIASTKQEALNRATQRAQITGQNLGGLDTARVGETADRFSNYGANANQQFQQNLQGIGASGQSYLDKINAIAPFIQSQNTNKAADRENTYKVAIAQAQAAADAAAAKIAQQQAFELQKLGITESGQNNRTLAGIAARKQAADAAASKAATSNITLPQLIGAANSQPGILSDSGNILGQAVGGERQRAAQLGSQAAQIGANNGVPANKLAGLTEPGFQNSLMSDLVKGNKGGTLPVSSAVKTFYESKDPASLLSLAPQIAAATKINGGAQVAQEIMSDPKFQQDLKDNYDVAFNGNTVGKKTVMLTWPQVVSQLQKEYITDHKGHKVPQDRTYAVMLELLRDLPWKK